MFCVGAALFGGMILLPLYWQTVRHESVVVTGLLTAPQGLGAALVMPIAGRLTDRYGGGPLTLFGVTLCTVGDDPVRPDRRAHLDRLAELRDAGPRLRDRLRVHAGDVGRVRLAASAPSCRDATPQLNVLQRVGGSIGTAVLAVVLQRSLTGAHSLSAQPAAYGTAFWAAAGLTAPGDHPVADPDAGRASRRQRQGRRGASPTEVLAEAVAA